MSIHQLCASNLGPILEADVLFGDLTVLVGPQASGKSVFLQTLKLAVDRNQIHDTFFHHNTVFEGKPEAFVDAFYGRGMGGMLAADPPPKLTFSGWSKRDKLLSELTKPAYHKGAQKGRSSEKLFYIPAQRVVSLPSGQSLPFGSFQFGDPYVLRYFADRIHHLLQNEFGSKEEIFPANNRLNADLRRPIEKNFFGGARLELENRNYTKTLELKLEGLSAGLPFLAWSAGQREFTPLLLGMYWLCPAGALSIRDDIEWVVIEEPEMGLHPRAIASLLLLVLELMRRGYRVVISTHSTVVLDLVWAMQIIRKHGGQESDVRRLFEINSTPTTKAIAGAALRKDYRVYFFDRGKVAQDISSLDPTSPDTAIAYWGGLTGFADRTGDVIADVVNRFDREKRPA